MKKILFINSILWPGGVEKTLLNIANQLSNNEYEVTILTIYEDQNYESYLHGNVIYRYIFKDLKLKGIAKKFYNKFQYELLMKGSFLINRYFIGKKYDTVIGFSEGFPTKIASYTKSAKKIGWIHTDFKEFRWSYKHYKNSQYEWKAYNRLDEIVCVSISSQINFINTYNFEKKAKLIYNLLDEENIFKLSTQKITDINFDKNKKYICFIGRFAPIKRIDRLINAFYLLTKEVSDINLLLIGDGGEKEQIINQIKRLKLQEKVVLLGLKNNPYKYLSKSHILVCSSDSECAPITICEALLLNVPVVTTNCPGAVEMIGSGKYGMISEKNDESLYKALKEILTNDNLLNNYRTEIKKRNSFINSKKIIEELKSII
ncbi:glycosyltransferase [Turicibacter bilis]|uniref:glycosyltransferase n=1 Tax=Turicibacter bilis TaxID=2735723 RepID=UPI001BAF3848|nr:glycosyltransferase [Turicibacter bilis]MBS3203740.1 glycosyltransferase [Turicibacter bilis]UUF11103.1 glycosyltransferase [Turicibacter bilis]